MNALKKLRLLWQGRKVMSEIEKADKQGFEWGINLRKALKAAAADVWKVVALALAGLILDPTFWTRLLEGNVPPAVLLAALPIIGAFTESGRNWLKHRFGIALALLVALLMPSPAWAQTPPPASDAARALGAGALEVDLSGWTQAIVTRGEKREVAGGRVVVDYAISDKLRAFSRIDITGAQDFGTIEAFGQYQSFRAVETFGGLRYQVKAGVAVAAVGGTSWSIEGADGPLDPRMATALLLVRLPLPGGGHAYIGGGHRGPVGGAALVGSVTYPAGPTRLIVDYDLPLTTLEGLPRPGVLKTGVAVPVWRRLFR